MRLGYSVSQPISENTKYDLIVDASGALFRTQVKATYSHGGVLKVKLRSTSEWVQYRYTSDMIDWLIAVDLKTDATYLIDYTTKHFDGMTAINLRLLPPKKAGGSRGKRLAEHYVL